MRVLICGTGSGAHALAGITSRKPEIDVRVFALRADKADRWRAAQDESPLKVVVAEEWGLQSSFEATSILITTDPGEAAAGCDIIILAAPAFLHREYLVSLRPYLERGCTVVGLPGQTGFEFEAMKTLGHRIDDCVILNFESLPWVCRLIEFGRSVRICGIKDRLVGASRGDTTVAHCGNPLASLQHLLGEPPTLSISGHLLGISLRSPNACSHPAIMYGCWNGWSGDPLERPPLFYHGVDEFTASLLAEVCDEVLRTSTRIMAEYPEVDLSNVIPMYEWDLCCYGKHIKDKTNLMTALRTNSIYAGMTHPMVQTDDGRYVPDFNHRFLTEDVPFGLVVIRGIAEIAGVATPHIDTVLTWCQQVMGKQYLVGSRLIGKDLLETRCPQRYGFTTIAQLLGYRALAATAQEQ